ncbi:MAG TPA: HDOD domain-containing protein, partial [Motiliproteus sp.]
ALFGKIHKVNTQRIYKLSDENDQAHRKNDKLVTGLISASHKYDPDVAGSELIQSIILKIPRLPVSTSALLGKLMDRRSTTQEIVELVKQDPSLTGSVLKTINSSRFAFAQKISDVNHAVMLLGYDGVYQMVMASGIRKCLPDTPLFQEMYERSLALSSIAFFLSQESRVAQPAELATIGLLHQIGLTVTELLKQHYPKMIPLIMYLEDTDMGAALLRAWNIPNSVAKTIERQRYPEFAPPREIDEDVRKEVAILYLAQLCYRRIMEGDEVELPLLFLEDYLAELNWSQESLDSIVDQILLPKLRKQRKGLPQALVAQIGE